MARRKSKSMKAIARRAKKRGRHYRSMGYWDCRIDFAGSIVEGFMAPIKCSEPPIIECVIDELLSTEINMTMTFNLTDEGREWLKREEILRDHPFPVLKGSCC